MKLLCLPGLLACCLALAGAVDFKHFPVQTGRADSARTAVLQTPAKRPPGNRDRVREIVRKSEIIIQDPSTDYSDEDEDVQRARVIATTERVRLNRNRVRGRTRISTSEDNKSLKNNNINQRTRISASEKRVETTAKPIRQRIRIRTKPPRQETTTTRQRPTVEITTAGLREQTTETTPVIELVVENKPDVKKAQTSLKVEPFIQTHSVPQLNSQIQNLTPNFPAEAVKSSEALSGVIQTANPSTIAAQPQPGKFIQLQPQPSVSDQSSEAISGVIHTANPSTIAAQPQPGRFIQLQPQPSFADQPKPTPLRVFTQNSFQPRPIQTEQSIIQEPVRLPQPSSSQQRPGPTQPIQVQTQQFQPLPAQPQQLERQPPQRRPFQPQPPQPHQIPARPLQVAPERPTQPAKPIFTASIQQFEERPSLFSIPIEIPQQDGTGASFSYEAFVG